MKINNILMVWKTKRSKVLTFLYTSLDRIQCFSPNIQIETLREVNALCVLIFGLFRYIPRSRMFREKCTKLQNVILILSLSKILHQRMSDYQQLLLYKSFNLSRHFVIRYGVRFYEPTSAYFHL